MTHGLNSAEKCNVQQCSETLGRLVISGPLTCATVSDLWPSLDVVSAVDRCIRVDTSGVTTFDNSGIAMLVAAKQKAFLQGIRFEVEGMPSGMQATYDRMNGLPAAPAKRHSSPPFFESLGSAVAMGTRTALQTLSFLGELTVFTCRTLRKPATFRWADCAKVFERAGVDAIPVVMLISFLLGLILAFESVIPLKMFGAQIYVANLIGISIIRELGTLVAAIVLAGRTSSAFAAEIGTMTVNEEINALKTMGIEPVRFLVLPRVFAVALALPLLSLFADLAGLTGGFVVISSLGYSFDTFCTHAMSFVKTADLLVSLFKAFVFGILIAGIGCLCGLQTGHDADSVGRSTTNAVVRSIVAIAIADGLFAFIFYVLGI